MHFTVQYVLSRKYLYLIFVCWRHSVFKYVCFSEKTCEKFLRRGLSAYSLQEWQKFWKTGKRREIIIHLLCPQMQRRKKNCLLHAVSHILENYYFRFHPHAADRDLFIWFSCAKTRVVQCSLQCRNYQVKRACKNHEKKKKRKTPMTFSSLLLLFCLTHFQITEKTGN